MSENPNCPHCGRKVAQAGALNCTWCGRTLRKHPATAGGFRKVVDEATALLRKLGPKEQEDALLWLEQNLRLHYTNRPPKDDRQGELFGASSSSTPAASSETAGPESLSSGSSLGVPEDSPVALGNPPHTTHSPPTPSSTPPSPNSKPGKPASGKGTPPSP